MTATFTKENVIAAMHAAVEAKGEDYVYPNLGTCMYSQVSPEGNVAPSCIVGHVVAAIDPEYFDTLAEFELVTATSANVTELFMGLYDNDDFDTNIKVLPLDAEEDDQDLLQEALRFAQLAQDTGLTWGQSLSLFDAIMSGEDKREVMTRYQAAKDARTKKLMGWEYSGTPEVPWD